MTTVATTTSGQVRGASIAEGVVFKGIPFAAPPVAERRYLPPAPAPAWDGERDCTAFGPICPQFQIGALGGALSALGSDEPTDEDCLFLNVWTPAVDGAKRPTMVWIHGGAFTAGSGSTALYDGATFARDGVVLVSINYRLNALGFLYLDELFEGAEGTGNLGILDQVAALEWVRDNIANFGGDPDNVTIFGESAGGMSVTTLLATPRARGLFRRAIPESGAGHHNIPAEAATTIARRFLEVIEVAPGDWDALRAVPADRLVAAATQVGQLEAPSILTDESNKMGFSPAIDGVVRDQLPVDAVRAGAAAEVDLLIGTCAEEWRLFMWALPMPDPDIAPYFSDSGRTVDEILKIYGANRPGASTRDLLAAVQTDFFFTIPAIRLAEAQVGHRERVWMYRFDWRSPVLNGDLGACHALEIPFVFDGLAGAEALVGDAPPQALADAVHAAWVRFARTGDPSGGELPVWPSYDKRSRSTMIFDAAVTVADDPSSEERQLWDGLL